MYLTEIPRLRGVKDWPDLVEILEQSRKKQRNKPKNKADQSQQYVHTNVWHMDE